ncbi:MAG: TIGR04283 family arsenosugar biosynthesis glycosyltransferase, partial [Candidatus Acidiferrales bacterium]
GEIIVADGSSTDATLALAKPFARIVVSEPRRGKQLNRAAALARGDILCFLHADVRLPAAALAAVESAMWDPEVIGGTFALRFGGPGSAARLFTFMVRSLRRIGILFGDQGIFVRRSVFERLGGFRDWPLLEDYEFAHRLVKAGKTVCLPQCLQVSSRRWEAGTGRRGRSWRTMATWFFIMAFYFLGVSPERLARWYPPVRAPKRAAPPVFRATQRRLN